MNHPKYIIFVNEYDVHCAVVFGDYATHAEVAGQRQVLGAGFCCFDWTPGIGPVQCWGKSTTLGVKSRGEEDARLIRKQILQLDD